MKRARISTLLLTVTLGLTGLACSNAAPDDSSPAGNEEDFTAKGSQDVQKSEQLLAEAVRLAERHAAGEVCDLGKDRHGVDRPDIVELLREAIVVRDTDSFRASIAKRAVLAKVLAGSLEWQEILGTYDPKEPATIEKALATGVSIWDTDGGTIGDQRLDFKADGQAVHHVREPESDQWTASPTTWAYRDGRITLGTGAVYEMGHGRRGFLFFTEITSPFPEFVSMVDECW